MCRAAVCPLVLVLTNVLVRFGEERGNHDKDGKRVMMMRRRKKRM